MKPLIINDDFGVDLAIKIESVPDIEYPYNIYMNDGTAESSLSLTKADAEAMRDWLVEVLAPLENK